MHESKRTFLGLPSELVSVGNDASGYGGSVVAAETDQHQSELRNLAFEGELEDFLVRFNNPLRFTGTRSHLGGCVLVLGLDQVVRVFHVGGLTSELLAQHSN